MQEKINIIQFMPYFPPHKGGLETVGEEIGKYWEKHNLGNFINVITDFNQKDVYKSFENIIFEGEKIGYKKDGYEVLVVPSFEIINNFPVYKIWSQKYTLIKKYLTGIIGEDNEDFRVFTHTRFFITSFIGGLFARKNKIKWIHIEHGSDYVKLSSKFFSVCSYVYDKTFGKWIFKKSDMVLAISNACKTFITKEFIDRDIEVFYRGLEMPNTLIKKSGDIKIVFIGRLVKLKGVDDLIHAFKQSGLISELVVIGDGEQRNTLKMKSRNLNVQFLGYKERGVVIEYLSENDCIVVNPSYQEGLPTSLVEALITGNTVVASDVGGTSEISEKSDLLLFEAGNIDVLTERLLYGVYNYEKLSGLSRKGVREKFDWNNNIIELYNLV